MLSFETQTLHAAPAQDEGAELRQRKAQAQARRQGCVTCLLLCENMELNKHSWKCSLRHCHFLCGSSFA